MNNNLLLVEDNPSFRIFIKEALKNLFDIYEAGTISEAKNKISNNFFNIVLLDINLPDGKGTDIIEFIKNKNSKTNIIILTAYGDIPIAIECIKKGAIDFWQKPIEYNDLINKVKRLITEPDSQIDEIIIGESDNIKQIRKQIKDIACTDVSVFITGESGTGKELIAKTIHELSGKKKERFVIIDFSLIKDSLFENELFGSVKGAFSGSFENKKGKLELGNEGTVFFDNIDNFGISSQGKLLRFIETKKFYPLGSNNEKNINVRLISACKPNINELINNNILRKDLYFRLNVYPINILPLNKRKADIIPIAQHYAKYFAKIHNKKFIISDKSLESLLYYDWPGNVRELINIIERVIITENEIYIDELINKTKDNRKGLKDKIRDAKSILEKNEIINALNVAKGNKSEAAKLLKISYRNLLDKIKEYKIE